MLWWTSNLVVLGGSMAYTRVKQLEMKLINANLEKGSSKVQ